MLWCTKFHQNLFTRSASRIQIPVTAECAVASQWPLPWLHHDEPVGNMMECDHPRFVQIGPLGGEIWHFQYFPIYVIT